MAYTVEILEALKNAENGLLSKIKIGNKTYEIKDLIARENIETLGAGLDKVNADLSKAISDSAAAIKTAYEAADAATLNSAKAYADAVAATINKFDVAVVNALPAETPSAENMYILYLVPKAGATGTYVEYIAIRSGEEGAYTYAWEQIGSTAMDLTGFVTEDALADTLKDYHLKEEAHAEHEALEKAYKAADKEITDSLKDFAFADQGQGTVAGQTISNIKATGTSTGSINVALKENNVTITSEGNYTPAGTVTGGKVTPAGTVAITVTNADAQAVLATADYQPAGSVSVTPTTEEVQVVKNKGTAASFTEGEFHAATLDHSDVTANYVDQAIVGSVDGETLTFTEVATKALAASKVNSFSGGSKDADTFNANVPAEVETKAVMTAVAGATFTGTVATGLKVTGVTYQKHDTATATFTGSEVDVNGATFNGDAATISVNGGGKTYAIDTENTKFNGAAIELNVGDIVVDEKTVTVVPVK